MEKETRNGSTDQGAEMSYDLLPALKKGETVTLRDDLLDFQLLLETAKLSRRKGIPFRIVDSGSLDILRIEWLASEGAVVYSSDQAMRKTEDLERLGKSCKKAGAFLAYFQHKAFGPDTEAISAEFQKLMKLGAEGIHLFLSNKEEKRDWRPLCDLADRCRSRGSRLVYYHHGPIEEAMNELARNGGWIHIEDNSLNGEDSSSMLLAVIASARSAEANVVLHTSEKADFYLLKDVLEAGAFLLFRSPLLDFRSPLKPLEEKASQKKLDAMAFYMYETFFF